LGKLAVRREDSDTQQDDYKGLGRFFFNLCKGKRNNGVNCCIRKDVELMNRIVGSIGELFQEPITMQFDVNAVAAQP